MAFRFRLAAAVAILLTTFSPYVIGQPAGRMKTAAQPRTPSGPASGPVTLTPAVVEAGSPELIRVDAPTATSVEGEWFGHKLQFFRAHNSRAWYALAGVDVEAAAVPTTLRITAHLREDRARDLSTQVAIHAAHYRTGSLSVAPRFVEPGPEEMKQIDLASKAKEKVFATTADRPLWSGSFVAPVRAAPTDSFGTRRMFNGKLASIHKGMDFRAAFGTPIMAGNSGVVVLAQPLYYEGNCVMIDHGLGLMSISMHLSRIDVRPGEHVSQGQRLGLSGATGRVTGPHLHWAIRWQGAMLDPAKLLRLDLDKLP
ncbi:M23 family metallopeptidase [Acidicapsa ligni]|uniref:M23 family metallopeptidase n=1 Tax=Acidicapsa ligni TaxID=542300 RepID=UPI0021DF84F3|nr:M23 family metallopeptidase [Acidicapsa ligni]